MRRILFPIFIPFFFFLVGQPANAQTEPREVQPEPEYILELFNKGFVALQNENYEEAFKYISEAAELDFAFAQYLVGQMYYQGQGVPKNDAAAFKWTRLAAEQGYAEAQSSLGLMYESGEGVPQSDIDAVKWYRLASEQSFFKAQYNLSFKYSNGEGVPKNYVQAYKWGALAKALGEEKTELLNQLTDRMTREQIAEAQSLAAEWWEAHRKEE